MSIPVKEAQKNWQINSMLFERIALSKDKKGVLETAQMGQQISKQEDLLKDPYVFEFLFTQYGMSICFSKN